MQKRKIIRTERFRRSFKKLPENIKKGFDEQIKKLLKERDKLCLVVAKGLYNLRREKIGKWEKTIS